MEEEKTPEKLRVTRLVIAVNIFLILAKAVVVVLTGSLAVLASLADSVFDLLGSFFAWLGVREASKPSDEDHPYGHRKMENISSLAQLLLIAATALFIINEAMNRLNSPVKMEVGAVSLGVIAFNVIVNIALAYYLGKKSRETKSIAIEASAGNYMSDIFQNSLALVGLYSVSTGHAWADPVAALLISFLMLRVVYKIGVKTISDLLDKSPPKGKIQAIENAIGNVKGVKSFHKLRAREVNGNIYLDVEVQMKPDISLKQAHALAHKVKNEIIQEVPDVIDAVIHVEPYEANKKYCRVFP